MGLLPAPVHWLAPRNLTARVTRGKILGAASNPRPSPAHRGVIRALTCHDVCRQVWGRSAIATAAPDTSRKRSHSRPATAQNRPPAHALPFGPR